MTEPRKLRQGRSFVLQVLLWGWASPGSLVGLIAGASALLSGGGMRRVGPTLEFWGGAVTWLLRSRWVRAQGMTLGHVVIGETASILNAIREHEWVHVRQYERWGPCFLPAYLGCSALLWLRGRDFYWENPFEVEAYAEDFRRMNAEQGQPPDVV